MFRKLVTLICLLLMLAVTLSWLRSLTISEAYTLNVAKDVAVIARHAQGAFTIACQQVGVVFSMPHWVAVAMLSIWPLFHLRVKMDDRTVVVKKR
jgi:hypothetical protein